VSESVQLPATGNSSADIDRKEYVHLAAFITASSFGKG
jgi:hypothetical protein